MDIPRLQTVFNPAKDCKSDPQKGDCVLAALNRFIPLASNSNPNVKERLFALKFIVHLVGDMHQPLHCADDNDRGGNNVKVSWFGRKGKGINLHSVWDRLIIEQAGLDEIEFANELEDEFTEQQVKGFLKGTLVDWANESHRAARDFAYGKMPADRVLGQQYYDETFAVVDEQLFKGGVRLAAMLNTIT